MAFVLQDVSPETSDNRSTVPEYYVTDRDVPFLTDNINEASVFLSEYEAEKALEELDLPAVMVSVTVNVNFG